MREMKNAFWEHRYLSAQFVLMSFVCLSVYSSILVLQVRPMS